MKLQRAKSSIKGLATELEDIKASIVAEQARAIDTEDSLASNLATTNDNVTALETKVDDHIAIITGDTDTDGSIAKAQADAQAYADEKVAAIVDGSPDLLDTLKELSEAIGNDENFATTVANDIAAAKKELRGAASEAMDTMEEVETAVNARLEKSNNLSDIEDIEEARTNLDVMSTQEVKDAISGGATTRKLEKLTVDGDSITLTLVPVNGIIENFGMVRFLNDDGTVTDVSVKLDTDDDSNKVYKVEGDSENEFDGKDALVQYTGINE